MSNKDRQPPRFVPTLTEVVVADHVTIDESAELLAQAAPVDHGLKPAVQDVEKFASFQPPAQSPQAPAAINLSVQELQNLSDQALARVMGRVDVVLQERLDYALAEVVQLHTAALYQAMRHEVEQAVRTSVQEAIAEELAKQRTSR